MTETIGKWCLAAGIWCTLQVFAHAQAEWLNASPMGLRQDATFAPLPQYPPDCVASSKQGKVVVGLLVKPDGTVDLSSINIIESTHDSMAESVSMAIRSWKFRYPGRESGIPLKGNLIFYFRIVNGRSVVVDAAAEAIAIDKAKREASHDSDASSESAPSSNTKR